MSKKNNTAEKAILDASNISKALKESTQNSLRDIMTEAISNIITESEDDDFEDNEDSYEVEDVDTEKTPETDETPKTDDEGGCEGGSCETNGDSEGDDDEWSDMEQYKVGDNDYDFTSVEGPELLKVYNKLGDDDQIFVKKTEDGNYEVKDEETGAEFVIELDADALGGESDNDYEGGDDLGGDDFGGDEDIDIEFDGDDEGDDDEYEFELGDDDEDDDFLNEENLGYTTSYQKDVMPGLNMNEPADSKTTYSMDGGAPKGNSRPYSGYENKKSNLFTKSVNEEDFGGGSEGGEMLDEDGSGLNTKHSTKKSTNHINKGAYNQRHSSENGEYTTLKTESLQKIVNGAKAIQNENKQYKNALEQIKTSLKEAAVLNVTLAQVVKLLSENTATSQEKKSIVERFNNVRTIAESKSLYETIKRELNENKSSKAVIIDEGISATGSNKLNETTMYNSTNNPILNMMERMDNLYK